MLTINHVKTPTTIEALTYQYDPASNRVSLNRANAAASLIPTAVSSNTYDATNEQTQFNGVTQTFDNNGNLTNDGTNTISWDARNRLTGISGGITASFVYDGLGRRKSKTIGGTTTGSWYEGSDILAELSGGTLAVTYIRGLNIDEPYIRKGASDEFYETDALGSAVALTNGAGASQTTYAYQPFGATTQGGTTSTSPFQFTGRENDGTGLYYYRARYYNPTLQRFMGEDPLRFRTLDVNLYRYVLNNPANWVDPTGLETRIVIGRTTFAPFGFDTGIGVGHVGLYVDSGIDGGPMIYDPSGSYMNDIRGSGGIFSGPDAKWPDYLRYQTQGTQVDVFVFATTPEEEQRIARRAEMLGDPRGLACAASVSQVLQGIGPFKNLDPTVFPGRLRSQLYRLLKR